MLHIISKKILDPDFKEMYRESEKDFTRNRKLTFSNTLIFMLNLIRKSLVIEIHNFVEHLSNSSLKSVKLFTSSAYVQSRKKINPLAFDFLSSVLVSEFYTDNQLGVSLWKGHRLLAVDGSTINLPFSKTVAQKYGYARNQTGDTTIQGKSSVLYDTLNHLVIDASLNPRGTAERTLALDHLNSCMANDLILFDRGYFSYDFIKAIKEIKDIDFVIRLKADLIVMKDFIASGKHSQNVEIHSSKYIFKKKKEQKPSPIKVRLVRVELPCGEIEVLATSLINTKKYGSKKFKELYFKRWKVETFYDELKNKLKLEHFTGYSEKTIQQDFYATVFVSNIQSIIVKDIVEEIHQETKARKYNYKVNSNLSYGFLKNKIITLLFSEKDINKVVSELKILFKKYIIPIRPNRTFTRNKHRRKTTKHQVTKNQRDAI